MLAHHLKVVRPDAKGRIVLGVLAKGVSSFSVTQDKDHRIILEPNVEIPAREKWLFENKSALQSVKQGIKDAVGGRVSSRGSFAKYAKEDK
jgi:hypothetical protein